MSGSARVTSIDALKDFRTALCEFGVDAQEALAGADMDIRHAQDWLHEQLEYWRRQVRDRGEGLARAKAALVQREWGTQEGRGAGTTEAEIEVKHAKRSLQEAEDKIEAVRLSPKGLYRWYARCCNTPVGNTLTPSVPFVGVVAHAFEADGQNPDALFGRPVGAILGKFAIGDVPAKTKKISFPLLLRALRLVLGWRFTGKTWPHPFFERGSGAPRYPVTVLSREQRDTLRPLCGPRPQALTSA